MNSQVWFLKILSKSIAALQPVTFWPVLIVVVRKEEKQSEYKIIMTNKCRRRPERTPADIESILFIYYTIYLNILMGYIFN